jgi:SagB-type dehydrogenase family enzyme
VSASDGEDVRYIRARALIARWDNDRFVVDNYLTKDRVELTPAILQFIHTNPGPSSHAELVDALAAIDDNGRLVDALIGHHIYLADGTDEAVRDEHLNATWAWDHTARWFHYGTRDTPFEPNITRQQMWLSELATKHPPPPPVRTYPGQTVTLPPVSDLGESTVAACLTARRTARRWAAASLTSSDLSSLLWWTWGTQRFIEKSPIGPYQLKTSPSGGARHSIEVYPVALRVDGVQSGIYHYASREHQLTLIRSAAPEDLALEAVGWFANQPWVAEACVVFLMTSVVERSMWKYRNPHAYRVLLLDAGHLGQTFHVVCTALGLGPFTSSGLSESAIEEALGIDGIQEVPVYAAATGISVAGEIVR